MKLCKKFVLTVALVATGFLFASDDSGVNDILAKYGLDKPGSRLAGRRPSSSSMAGDLATQMKAQPKLTQQELQKTANTGKELERAIDKVDDRELDAISKSTDTVGAVEDQKADLEKDMENVSEKKPGALRRLWNNIKGLFSFATAAQKFNARAAANLKRFKVTFKNVSDALASVNEPEILIPEKDSQGRYVLDRDTKAVKWTLTTNDYSAEKLQALKQEALYIIIKEMVFGFKHLEPMIGSALTALSLLAPDVASQSSVVYEVAVRFLPLLEKLAKESLESSTTSSNTMSNNTMSSTTSSNTMSNNMMSNKKNTMSNSM